MSRSYRKYERLPVQEFIIQRYIRPRTSWERRYQHTNAKGVWVIACHTAATNPWQACARARASMPVLRGKRVRLRAIPTFQEVNPNTYLGAQ